MGSIELKLNAIVKKDFESFRFNKILISHNKNDNYPVLHTLYTFNSIKSLGKEVVYLKYYPLVYFRDRDNYEIIYGKSKLKKSDNYFQIVLNHNNKSSVLNSGGNGFAIIPEYLRNYGLGSFAFYKIINFVKEHNYGHYPINKQTIGGSEKYAYDRFMFYLKHGLSLSSQAVKTEGKSGEYFASSLLNLQTSVPENILFDFTLLEYNNFLSIYNSKLKKDLESIS